jgi:PEP-CTERM motif-containing protein
MTIGKVLGMAAIALMAVGAAGTANATVFNLTSDHCTGTCGTGPFGNITLIQNGANVDVTVHLNSPNFFVTTGAGDGQVFLFNAVGVVLGDITIDAHVPVLAAATGAFGNGGVGTFAFGINCPGCGNGAPDSFNTNIVFHVANATIADLTAPNASGNIFVADIFSSNLNGLNGNGNTGLVDASIPGVPEPITSGLVGTGLIGLFLLRRRKA